MTDAEELAVLREFAHVHRGDWTCMGDLYIGVKLNCEWIARRIADNQTRGISYADGSILAEGKSPGQCVLAARAKLQAERDAKDAPRLREALEKIRDKCGMAIVYHEKPVCHWAAKVASDALKGES